jgi:hypothetical protein
LDDVVCDLHHTRGGGKKCDFFGLVLKLGVTVCQWFGLKTTAMISWFAPQNQCRQFGDLCLKITAMISWFEPQNQAGFGLSVAP